MELDGKLYLLTLILGKNSHEMYWNEHNEFKQGWSVAGSVNYVAVNSVIRNRIIQVVVNIVQYMLSNKLTPPAASF